MNLFAAFQQLIDLPDTFRRTNQDYINLMEAIASALTLFTQNNTNLTDQIDYDNATAGWVDVWADLAGILRRTSEADIIFWTRLPNMLLAWRDSGVAIEEWLKIVENVQGLVVDNVDSVGYTLTVPATLTLPRLQQILNDLAYVRPAGVPFNFVVRSGGTYLTTVNYCGVGKTFIGSGPYPFYPLGGTEPDGPIMIEVTGNDKPYDGRVTGAYLAANESNTGLNIPASTNNQQSALPDLLFVDPTLNPPGG